ncbi:hypothetical protein FHG66_05990 [Rubellimicrobium rubrum]|uniref:Uncharacterized protein n=1 Tax=Rubellimicrobium rubrum TaxID=2585369 RepID=A0A5C4N3L1_9RHOB|nr:hypothetical protein [Rubellimicrobium rubrum]TNC51102.1 hypothetical protein FHG66_05990 [Rubellimicrobium rubrum]
MGHLSTVATLPVVHDGAPAMRSRVGEAEIIEVEAFVDRHVLPLHRLAGALAGDRGEELVERLVEIFSDGTTVASMASEVIRTLEELRDLLAQASHQQIDDLGQKGVGGANLHAAVNYYGARLTDMIGIMGR